jgi:hypothetical protein
MAEREFLASSGNSTPRRRAGSDKIRLLKNRVETARRLRRDWRRKYRLDDLYRQFYSDMADTILNGEDSSVSFHVNKMLPTIKTVLPSLFLQNPTFVVRSMVENQDATSILKAKMGEAALKAIADQEHHLEFSIRLALLQSFFSIGVLKCVYEPRVRKNPRAGEIMYERTAAGFPTINEDHMPVEVLDETGMPMLEPDTIVEDEVYRWDWVNGDKMLLPDHGPQHLRWPWIAEEVTVLLEDARHDERFNRNLRTQLRANTADLDDQEETPFSRTVTDPAESKDEYLTYIEFWDIRERRQIIWVEGQTFSDTQCLLDRDTPEYVEDHPYPLLLGYTPIIAPRSSPWPLPYVYTWLPLQQEHNVRRRQLTTGANRTARKVFFEDATFEDENEAVKFLQSSEDMQAIKITNFERPPIVHSDPMLPPNIAQDLSLLEADWAFETGVSGARTGGRNKGPDTVFDSKVAVSAGEARDLAMRHDVNVWLTSAGKKMFRLLKSTMTLGMYVRLRSSSDSLFINYVSRVYGPGMAQQLEQFPSLRFSFDQQFGNDKWIQLSPEELDFEASISVAPGSARPRNMETEKQDFMQIVQLLGAVPVLTQSRALLTRVADMFEFFDTAMIDEILGAAEKANQIEQMKAGRMQGNQDAGGPQMPAAYGGGANMSSFRRDFVG